MSKPDFTVIHAELEQCWDKPGEARGFVVRWATRSAGFGETVFVVRRVDGKDVLVCDNEAMSRDFVKAVLARLVDEAEMRDEGEPPPSPVSPN